MAKLSVMAGSTSQSVTLFFLDNSKTDGSGLAAIAPASGSLLSGTVCYYTFNGANAGATAISLSVLAATNSAWSSGGIVTLDDTHMQGAVRFDIPNACLASGNGRSVEIQFSGGTHMAIEPLEIELTGWDNQDSTRGGMSALPNASAGGNGGLATVDANNNIHGLQSGSGTGQFLTSAGYIIGVGGQIPPTYWSEMQIDVDGQVTVGTNNDKSGYSLANSSFVTTTFGTCDFTSTMKSNFPANFASFSIGSDGVAKANIWKFLSSTFQGGELVVGTAAGLDGGLAIEKYQTVTGTVSSSTNSTVTVSSVGAAQAGWSIFITGNTGVGQVRTITGISGLVLTLDRNWVTNPASSAPYRLAPANAVSLATGQKVNEVVLVDTTTNLTNAPTNGDLTATMKASVTTAATAATPTAAAVTGNVGGNVTGSVGSVIGNVKATDTSDNPLATSQQALLLFRNTMPAIDTVTQSISVLGATTVSVTIQDGSYANNFVCVGDTLIFFDLNLGQTPTTRRINSVTNSSGNSVFGFDALPFDPSGDTGYIDIQVFSRLAPRFDSSGNTLANAEVLPNPSPSGYGSSGASVDDIAARIISDHGSGSYVSSDAGSGDTPVSQDTGGTDNLRFVTANGDGIGGATILAYLSSEYTSTPLTATLRGKAVTGADGRWAAPMMLDTGYTYTFVFTASGYQTVTKAQAV